MHLLRFRNLTKSYAGIVALSGVNLDLVTGEVHALMGENGAGKSTLIKLLAGVIRADQMAVFVDETPIALTTAADADAAGFRFIHQELNIVPALSVAENILLSHPTPRRFGLAVDWPLLRTQAQNALMRLGIDHIALDQPAGRLPPGDQMLIKIAAALVANPARPTRLLVLDEPTAALTAAESAKLFAVIARLKAQGAAVLYVSHRLTEVMAICDHVTVLRDGKTVYSDRIASATKPDLITAMTGRTVEDGYPRRTMPVQDSLACVADDYSSARLRGITFSLRKGEILGVAGLADAGQSEVLRAFLGLDARIAGSLSVFGKPAPLSPAQAWRNGVAYVPRERRAQAVMLGRTIRDNIMLPHLSQIGRLAQRWRETALAQQLGAAVRLKSSGPTQPAGQLSGGNQQKVVFARALGGDPALLLLDEPTRGVDVGAKFDIYRLVRARSAAGCAIIVASSDLPELLGMCDRILILQDGRQTGLVDPKGMTPADLLAQFYQPLDRSVRA